MKQLLLLMMAVALVGCGESESECKHDWSKWDSFSANPEYSWRDAESASIERRQYTTPKYVPATNGMAVLVQTRECSKCWMIEENPKLLK